MSAVLATPPFLQFQDSNGEPLAGGLVHTFSAGTNTPKATYTDESATVEMPNPIVLDSSGKATWWIAGSYKYVVKDSLGNTISTTDNVTAFNTLAEANEAYFESFSGNGTQTVFTTSQDLGTEEKALMVFVDSGLQENVVNGSFATDTDWTKGAGWTIGAGVATATGAISTAISQTSAVTLVAGEAYAVTYTITRSAGGLIPSIGGQNGTERTASGTYREVIVAGSTQTIAFTGNGFTGTLDNVSVTVAATAGYNIISPTAYTISGTSLTFATAPATGTNNIYVFAPSLLLGAASAAADAAVAAAAQAATSAASAAAYAQSNGWNFSTSTTMADPSSGNIRFNNAAFASTTALAISVENSDTMDLSAWIATWDNSTHNPAGSLYIRKSTGDFVIFGVTGVTDNTTWYEIAVDYIDSGGSFSDTNLVAIGFTANGSDGTGGDIFGPGSSTDNAIVRFNGTAGTSVQNSLVTVSDTGAMNIPGLVTATAGINPNSSAGSTLNSFVEGNFTPVFYGSSTAGSPTGTFNGRYQRVGNVVHVWVQGVFTGLSTMAGNLRMSGLPYTIGAASVNRGGISVGYRANWTNDFVIGGYGNITSDQIYFFNMGADNTPVTISDLSATSEIYFEYSYRVGT